MNAKDCKPTSIDVVAPQIPMVLAIVAMSLSVFALIKVLQLDQRIENQRG